MPSTDAPKGTIPVEDADLMGKIVSANVKNLAVTTDAIIENLESQVLGLAKTLVALDDVLAEATVMDRKTEAALRTFDVKFEAASRIVERLGSKR